jgi:ABC-type Fe3+ transport system permease subunit
MSAAVIAFAFFVMFWIVFYAFWDQANQTLNKGWHIEPHLRPATYWFAEWGLWIPTIVTIIAVVLGILVFLADSGTQTQTRTPPDRLRQEDMSSTDFERELRKRLKDAR